MSSEATQTFRWKTAINETFQELSQHVIDYVPQLIGAVLLLLVGWVIARLARAATKKVIAYFNSVFGKLFKHRHIEGEHFHSSYAPIICQVVFWCVIFFFAAASANLLGWNVFSGWMGGIVEYLPRLLTGMLILLSGVLIGNVVQSLIINTDLKIGVTQAAVLASAARIFILIGAFIIGVEHIGLNMHFLTEIITILLAVILAGACLAFGLGAKQMVANTIGAQYIRRNCRVGEFIKLADYEGEILEIRQTCIVLDVPEGRAIIPASEFHKQVTLVQTTSEQSGAAPAGSTDLAKDQS